MTNPRTSVTLCLSPPNPALRTEALFDEMYVEHRGSPISEFHTRLYSINRLSPQPANFDELQAQLVLLGVIAAVESYIRALYRKLLIVDEQAASASEARELSFGAAMHLSRELMPEGILEKISFISEATIWDSTKQLLGIRGEAPADLKSAMQDYTTVCQLRHCAVHRFGKLGASNAIKLGLSTHKHLLEKPLKLSYSDLQNAIAISTCFVRTLNNFLFNELLSRLPTSSWQGTYARDRTRFSRYYKLFADKTSVSPTASPSAVYAEFRAQRVTLPPR